MENGSVQKFQLDSSDIWVFSLPLLKRYICSLKNGEQQQRETALWQNPIYHMLVSIGNAVVSPAPNDLLKQNGWGSIIVPHPEVLPAVKCLYGTKAPLRRAEFRFWLAAIVFGQDIKITTPSGVVILWILREIEMLGANESPLRQGFGPGL